MEEVRVGGVCCTLAPNHPAERDVEIAARTGRSGRGEITHAPTFHLHGAGDIWRRYHMEMADSEGGDLHSRAIGCSGMAD